MRVPRLRAFVLAAPPFADLLRPGALRRARALSAFVLGAAASVLSVARPAAAQPAPPAPAADAAPAAPPEIAPTPSSPPPEIAPARADAVEPPPAPARSSQPEITGQPSAEASSSKKSEPAVSIGPQGFVFSSPDKAFQLRPRITVQADARIFVNDEHRLTDTMVLRRARPYLDGTLAKSVTFRLMPDFADGKAVVYDVWADLKAAQFFRVRVGKFKVPFGLERLQSDYAYYLMERAYPTSLAPNRDIGAQIHGDFAGERLGYAIGVFNGVPDNQLSDGDVDDNKEIAARVWSRPFGVDGSRWLKGLVVGAAMTRGEKNGSAKNAYLPSYSSIGQNAFFNYLVDAATPPVPAATAVAGGLHQRATGHLYYSGGPVGILGEYVLSQYRVARSGVSSLLNFQAWQAMASLVVTGEDADFDGVRPRNNVDVSKGHWGAFEIVLRYSELEASRGAFPVFADPTKSARNAAELAAGVNWFVNAHTKVSADYAHTDFRGGATAAAGGNRDAEQVVLMRTQINF